MADIDNKVVSISFNNKQFMKDISDTMDVILKFNNATSGKNIDTSGLDNLRKAFQTATSSVSKDADSVTKNLNNLNAAANSDFKTGGIDNLRKALENTGMTAVDVEDTITALQQLSKTGISYASDIGVTTASDTASAIQQASNNTADTISRDVDSISDKFSMLEYIGIGVMINIGNKIADMGMRVIKEFSGISDGWQEYNSLTNSTQTILANTQRYGSTVDDVSDALNELNHYADLTTYAFSDMTRNIGYFTTAGVNLDDSVTAIKGLSNVGALFGADASAVARAGYQMSQALSAGVIKLMDWKSMVNAGMGGQILQDELIRTAAVMSGTSVDAMNDYIESMGGFNTSLASGWLTADVFLEAMKTFAGQTKEYYESLTDANGNRLYTDEEIDELVKLGETAMESATKVRTFQQMMDAFKESIGSGWQQTFSLIIGNLEEAKEFWTPINDVLSGLVSNFFELQLGSLELWRNLGGREELLAGISNVLTNISQILSAIGKGFNDAFGGTSRIGSRLTGITEAFTDLTEHLILSEEELGFLKDFFTGLFEPISLVVDVIFELIKALFDAGDSALATEHTADSIYNGISSFRKALLSVLGYIGSILKAGADFIRNNKIIKKVVQTFVKVVSTSFKFLTKVIAAPFYLLYKVWERYNIGEKLEELWTKVVVFFLPIIDAVNEVKQCFENWFHALFRTFKQLDFSPFEIFEEVFGSLKQLFKDIFDPTVSLSDAFRTFIGTLSDGKTGEVLDAIRNAFTKLWRKLKDTAIGQWFVDLKDKIQNAWERISQSPFGQWVSGIIENIKDFIGLDTGKWDNFWDVTKEVVTTVADTVSVGWVKIKNFFTELVDIFKEWFGISDDVSESMEELGETSVGAIGDGMFSGQVADLGLPQAKVITAALQEYGETIQAVEKMTPDPKESKFLNFLRDLPNSLRGFVDMISQSQIVENIREFFSVIFNSIREFFSQSLSEQNDDILTFFQNRIMDVENVIATLLGIPDFAFNKYGIFETIGATIASFINTFGEIKTEALAKAAAVVSLVGSVFSMLIQLNISRAIVQFSSGLHQAARGWKIMQKASLQMARASVNNTTAKVLLSMGVLILSIVVAVKLVAHAIDQGQGTSLGIAFAGILLVITIIMSFIQSLAKSVSETRNAGAAFRAISKTISSISLLLLTIILSIAGLAGIAALVSVLYGKMTTESQDMFEKLLPGIAIAFGVIVVLIGILIGVILHSINKMSNAGRLVSAEAMVKVMRSVGGMIVGITLMVAVLVGSLIGLTYFMESLNGDYTSMFASVGLVTVLLLLAAAAIVGLIYIAEHISSTASSVNPKNFRKTMLSLIGLLFAVTLMIALLVASMTGVVMAMEYVDDWTTKFTIATLIISALIWSVMGSVALIISQISKINTNQSSKITTFLLFLQGTLLEIGLLVAGLSLLGYYLSNKITNLDNFIGSIIGMGVILVLVIAALAVLMKVIMDTDMRKATWKRFSMIAAVMGLIMGSIILISASLSLLVTAMSASGFLSNGGSILGVVGAIFLMALIIGALTAVIIILAKSNFISILVIKSIAAAMMMATGSILIIAGAISLVATLVNDTTMMWTAMGVLAILSAVVLGSLIALSAIGKSNWSSIVASAASMVIASAAFLIIASALYSIANIDMTQLITAGAVMAGMVLIMGGILIALAAIGGSTSGAGFLVLFVAAAGILAIGAAYLMLGQSVNLFGSGLNKIVTAVERFSTAMNSLKNIDVTGINRKIRSLLMTVKTTANELKDIAVTIGSAVLVLVSSIIKGAISGLASGIGEGFLYIRDFIYENAPSVILAFVYLNQLILGAIHESAVDFVEFVRAEFGEGGTIRQLANIIEGFVVWLSERVFGWALDIVEAALKGLIAALSDTGKIRKIALYLELFVIKLKQAFMDLLGIPNFQAIGAGIALSIMDGIVQGLQYLLNDTSAGQAINAALNSVGVSLSESLEDLHNTVSTAADIAVSDSLTNTSTFLGQTAEDIQRQIDAINNAVSNDPTEYYRSISGEAAEATQSSNGFFDNIGSRIKEFLGIGDDFSLSSLFGDFNLSGLFGNDGGGLSSLTSGFGGLSDTLGGINVPDLSSMFNMDNGQMSDFSLSLSGIGDMLGSDEFINPVIMPTVDTSGVEFGIGNIEDMFNNADIGEFAIDSGRSILTSQRTDGSEETSGDTSVSYTQNIYYPQDAPAISVYRDTRNLIRGHVNH